MRKSILHALVVGAGLSGLCATACTNADLYHLNEVPPQPNKVTFTGTVCTDNPAERSFPLKVLYVVDTSPNLPFGLLPGEISLLTQRRADAVRDSVAVLRGKDTEFALIRFGGQSLVAPDGEGFTASSTVITEAAGALSVPVPCTQDGCRRTSQALSMAGSLVTGDLLSADKGTRSRTTYVIMFAQAGPIDDAVLALQVSGACDERCVLENRIAELREFVLDNGAADFRFYSFDVSPLSDLLIERDPTGSLLTRLSFAGAGLYRPICTLDDDGSLLPPGCGPQSYSFNSFDIRSARNTFVKKSFLVSNMNAVHTDNGAIPDSDADGLADVEEQLYGLDPARRDTDGDGIGDKIELMLATVGLDPVVVNTPPVCISIPTIVTDTDGDGLTDCEEVLLRSDPTLFDTDADGTPDFVEFHGGTNFLLDDSLVDSDFDGDLNVNELRAHTDARSADTIARAELSYLYRENDLGIRPLIFATQPRDINGVVVEDIGQNSSIGNGMLVYLFQDPPILAWRDAQSSVVGEGAVITEDGTYTLPTGCPTDDDTCDPALQYVTVSVTRALLPPYPVDELLRVSSAERQCIEFRVRNVTLVETVAADGRPQGMNDVRIYFGQVPVDRPTSFGIYRVAQFFYRFLEPDTKIPNIADQPVEDFRFTLFGE